MVRGISHKNIGEQSLILRNEPFYDREKNLRHTLIGADSKASAPYDERTTELIYFWNSEFDTDPRYVLLVKDSDTIHKATLGETGLVESLEECTEHGTRYRFLRHNAFGNFIVSDDCHFEQEVDRIYDTISEITLSFPYLQKTYHLFDFDAKKVKNRFRDFNNLFGAADIIPEYTDRMTVITVSSGCYGTCFYCPESVSEHLIPFDMDVIRRNIEEARDLVQMYHGPHNELMSEIHYNSADFLRFVKESGIKPDNVFRKVRSVFPSYTKGYAFARATTVKNAPIDSIRKLHYYGPNLMDMGINRWIMGFETLDERLSRFVNKHETSCDKMQAIRKLENVDPRIKPKITVQVGLPGKMFLSENGSWIDIKDTLTHTADMLENNLAARTKVLISLYKPVPGTRLYYMRKEGKHVRVFDTDTRKDWQETVLLGDWFFHELLKRNLTAEKDYEHAIQ